MSMVKRCHRNLRAQSKLFGLDAPVAFGASGAFGLCTKLGSGILVGAIVAVAAAFAVECLRKDRLPGVSHALRDFLRWPTFHPPHGSDRVPRFPSKR